MLRFSRVSYISLLPTRYQYSRLETFSVLVSSEILKHIFVQEIQPAEYYSTTAAIGLSINWTSFPYYRYYINIRPGFVSTVDTHTAT
jgi:hypothetical protein